MKWKEVKGITVTHSLLGLSLEYQSEYGYLNIKSPLGLLNESLPVRVTSIHCSAIRVNNRSARVIAFVVPIPRC